MGMAASQARLLSITSRIHDVEYQAQMIQSAKMQLALQEDEVYRRYNDALDAQTLTFQNINGNRVEANFNNLCGLGSINNKIATNNNYVFRDGSDKLIVPTDVYNAYESFGEGDPYAFAMYMLVGEDCNIPTTEDLEKTRFQKAEEDYFKIVADDDNRLVNLKERIDTLLGKIFPNTCGTIGGEDAENETLSEMKTTILNRDWSTFVNGYLTEDQKKANKDDIENLKEVVEEYKYSVYKGGREEIYNTLTENNSAAPDFDNDKFEYYLRWAKLIQNEEGLRYCTKASVYKEDFEHDADMFNKMLQSGRITIETVKLSNKGQITESATSAASDSNLTYSAKSSIDSVELKKAEAEYEKAMKDIDKKDKRFDMDLNKLETERTALTTEYDSVKQVIKDNIERTFGIFS